MLSRCSKVGAAIAAAGAALVITAFAVWAPRAHDVLVISGVLTAIGGGIVTATGIVTRRQEETMRPTENAYREGEELGYSKGWRDCARSNVRPVSHIRGRHRDAS